MNLGPLKTGAGVVVLALGWTLAVAAMIGVYLAAGIVLIHIFTP